MSTILAQWVPAEADLGPAMRACSEPEREFVVALFQTGCRNYTEAALLTGRYKDKAVAQASSSRMMTRPRVHAALDEFCRLTMKGGLPASTRALMEIANDSMHKDRFKAAVELLNRNGHIVETVQRHIVEHELSLKEVRAELQKLGVSLEAPDAIDAEFTEVTHDDGSEGLEDLIGG